MASEGKTKRDGDEGEGGGRVGEMGILRTRWNERSKPVGGEEKRWNESGTDGDGGALRKRGEGRGSDRRENRRGKRISTKRHERFRATRDEEPRRRNSGGLTLLADFGATVWANERCQAEFLAINPSDARDSRVPRGVCGNPCIVLLKHAW